MIEEYLPRIRDQIGNEFTTTKTPFGWVCSKGNWTPSRGTRSLSIYGKNLGLEGRVLHERILLITDDIPIRSHEEESEEFAGNLGDTIIRYVRPEGTNAIPPGAMIRSVSSQHGFCHGFRVEKPGLLYVAKALYPEFVEGDSFKVPENTYDPRTYRAPGAPPQRTA